MKVCFVGAGSIGKRHIRNLNTIMCGRDEKIEMHLLKKTTKPLDSDIREIVSKIVTTEEMLDADYDAIFITNPTFMHYQTLLDLNSKSDCFFIEKPVFDDICADTHIFNPNKTYYVACPLRYTNVLLKASEILSQEKVYSARAISSSYLPDWRPGQDYRETYSAHQDQGGGVRIDLIHEWDYLSALFGMPDDVKSLYGTYSDLELDSDDLAIYIARYPDKLVELHLDYFGRVTRRSLEVMTSGHVYVFDMTNSTILQDGKVISSDAEQSNEKYIREMAFFLSLVSKENNSTNDIKHAVEVMKIALKE